jgi:hypothetical protein
MQLKEFIKILKEYYGEYNKIVELTLTEYLITKFDENELELLFRVITDVYSNIYKVPPDKAKIMEIISNYNDRFIYEPEKRIGKIYYEKYKNKKQILD